MNVEKKNLWQGGTYKRLYRFTFITSKKKLGGFETKGNGQGGCEWIQGILSKRKKGEISKWAQNTFTQVEQVV